MVSERDQVLQLARAQTRDLLGASETYKRLPVEEQKQIYLDSVKALTQQFSNGGGTSAAMAAFKPAGQLIDDKRHTNQRIDDLGDIASDFVQAVDFPQFVSDLLTGVFRANLDVTVKQMEAYQRLLKEATKSLSSFITGIDNTAAFGYLADNRGDEFSLDFSDEDEDKTPENPQGMVLVDKDGNKVASAGKSDAEIDAQVRQAIMDAKIQMAREHRAMLRETLLMGVTRLVVERGNVKAGVIFDFKATEKIKKADKAATRQSSSSGWGLKGGGPFGGLLGGIGGGYTSSNQQAQITVSSAKSEADTSVAAKLTGNVDITFKSDYFKLDNFAAMYGPITREGGGGPAGGPAQAGGPPAGPAAPPAGR